MVGRFEGLSNIEWILFEKIFPVPNKEVRKYFRNLSATF